MGRCLLAIDRTYRQGIHVILHPTDAELEVARTGDLWALWSSERSKLLYDLVRPGPPEDRTWITAP